MRVRYSRGERARQRECTRAFVRYLDTFDRKQWSDHEIWVAMDTLKRAMDRDNWRWARRLTDRDRAHLA